MAKDGVIDHPLTWTFQALRAARLRSDAAKTGAGPITVNRIGLHDLAAALRLGFADFAACRSDAILLCVFYPLAGLVIGKLIIGGGLLSMAFPLVAGFALLGPLLATGLYQMSRVRETAGEASWADAFSVFSSPSIGSILWMGARLLAIFTLWLFAATLIYTAAFGDDQPKSAAEFLHNVLLTPQGWTLIAVGVGVGSVFAALTLAIGVISFPLLLDRNVTVEQAVETSLQAVRMNGPVILAWGGIVAGLLVLGSLPLLIGLAIVFPVLGHATWHLYRRVITTA